MGNIIKAKEGVRRKEKTISLLFRRMNWDYYYVILLGDRFTMAGWDLLIKI